ncbi:MAG TPA: hypothetical protein VN280_22305 [Variovorax sp.]|nr:hypothetical protein [Variovorax sp.]
MRIKFKAPDPRAGTIVQMDSSRGQFFVDNGSAVKMKDDGSEATPATDKPVLARADIDAALAMLPGENNDPGYVVRSMRAYFGDLFTADDEAKVREVMRPSAAKPSEGLKVGELKAALEAKGIQIPDGAKKQDLADLLDGAV